MSPPLRQVTSNTDQIIGTGYDSDTGSICNSPRSGSAVESAAQNPLNGYRTDFQPEGYQLDEPHFVSNPLKSFMQKAKLCLARLCLTPRAQGVSSSAHSTSNPSNATQNQPTHSIGMSARHNQQLAFAHLIQAAQDDSGIFEFANSRAAIEHLDVLSNGNKLPDNHRLKTTTLGQIVAAKAAASGDLDLGEGYKLKVVHSGLPAGALRRDSSAIPYSKLSASSVNTPLGQMQRTMRLITLEVETPNNGRKLIPCKLYFSSSFDGHSMSESDLKFCGDEFEGLCGIKDFKAADGSSSKTDPSKYQILSSSGCGRAAALATFDACRQKISRIQNASKINHFNPTQESRAILEAGQRSFHPNFGLGQSLKATIQQCISKSLENRKKLLKETTEIYDPNGLGKLLSKKNIPEFKFRAEAPIPQGPMTLEQARALTRQRGAQDCYVVAINHFLGLNPYNDNNVTSKDFVDQMANELKSNYLEEENKPFTEASRFLSALEARELDRNDSNRERETTPSIRSRYNNAQNDLKKVYEGQGVSHDSWINRHRGDQATLATVLNKCLDDIHGSESKKANGYWKTLPREVMARGGDAADSDAQTRVLDILKQPNAADLTNFILLEANHAANVVKVGKDLWIRTDNELEYNSLDALVADAKPVGIICDSKFLGKK